MRFNETEFDVIAAIKRINPKETDKFLYATALDNGKISRIKIENDLNFPFPYLEIDYNDIGNYKLNKYLADGYTLIDFYISTLYSDKTVKIAHTFYVFDMEVLSKSLQQTNYRIKAISYTAAILSSVPTYSSKTEKDGYTMSKEILNTVKYPLITDKESQSYFKVSGKSFFHITPTCQKTISNLKEIFTRTYSKDTGFLSLMFLLHQNKGQLYSVKKICEDIKADVDNLIKKENFIMVATDGNSLPNIYATISFLENNSLIDPKEKYRNLDNYKVKTFDYIKRKWGSVEFNPKSRSEISHSTQNGFVSLLRDVPKYVSDKCGKFEKVMIPLSEYEIGQNVWKVTNFTDVVQLTIGGVLNRDSGDAVILHNTADDSVIDRWQKDYICGRIVHMFEKGSYVNRMDLFNLSEKENKIYDAEMDVTKNDPQIADGSVDLWTRV